LAQNIGVEQGVNRFALAIWPWPMLETADQRRRLVPIGV
jgi:hypothetical protein